MKIKTITIALFAATVLAVAAKGVGLGWNSYSDPAVNTLKVYIAPGANSLVANGIASANSVPGVITTNVPSSATSVVINVPYSGTWNAVVTAVTTNGIESLNSNQVFTNLPPGAPINLRLQ